MTTIAEAAAAALQAKAEADARLRRQLRDTLVRIGRDRLAVLFGDTVDVTGLSVSHTDLETFTVVLSDGSVHLAVTDDGDVHLTEQQGGQWTDMEPVADLADLGAALDRRKG